jgi:hypothetical protein
LYRILLAELNAAGVLDWSRACVDGSHIRAKVGDPTLAPSPVDRRKMGSKHHLICDGRGTPLKVITTAANVNDVTQTRSRGVNRLVRSQQTKCHRSSTCLMRRQVDQHPLSIRPVRFLARAPGRWLRGSLAGAEMRRREAWLQQRTIFL